LGKGEEIDVDCKQVFAGDASSTLNAKEWQNPCEMTDEQVYHMTLNCSSFFQAFPLAFEHDYGHGDFPLAFVLVVEKSAEQVLRLLRAVYRPHHLFCITYDAHAEEHFRLAMHNIARCYSQNILMPQQHHEINWGGFSILEVNFSKEN